MKRFTETNKWRDPWFRSLSSPAKQLWQYLCENCDSIGLIEVNFKLTSADCGQAIKPEHITELGDRVQSLGNHRYFIPKFINFQYGELSDKCPPHRNVLNLVRIHKLVRDGLAYHYPNATLTSQIVENQANSYPSATLALPTRQDKNVQDKKEGGVGEIQSKPTNGLVPIQHRTPVEQLWDKVCILYKRPKPIHRSNIEETFLAEVCRRPDPLSEFAEIESFFKRLPKEEHRFFPTAERLFENWQKTLDRARIYQPQGNGKTI